MIATGTVKAQLVQMEVLPGRPRDNTANMLRLVAAAREEGAELVVFPEMAIPGYLLGDEWEHEAFLRECEDCGRTVRDASGGLVIVFGNVGLDRRRRNEDGRVRKYNALFAAEDGRFRGPESGPYDFVIKTLLPNYREFDDSRHFFDLRKVALEQGQSVEDLVAPVRTGRLSLGCLLCEDAWDTDYAVSPLDLLARRGVDVFVAINSSPFTASKNRKRHRVFTERAASLARPLIYVNNVGMQNNGKTVFTFDGCSCIYDTQGGQVPCGAPFEESALTFDLPLSPDARFGAAPPAGKDGIDTICRALQYGTRKFMELCGAQRVVVGVSGGIDSSVAAALYGRIVGPRDLFLVNMPGPFTSQRTRALATALTRNLGASAIELPIADSVALTRRQLDGLAVQGAGAGVSERLSVSDAVFENIQARDRSSRLLAAIAAAVGGVFTCNANKSEATVGYTTLYGDLAGYLANLADLWKAEVYDLARYLNDEVYREDVIPPGCMDVTPSAELSAAQNVDEGKGDPLVYAYHDLLFRSWVEWWNRATPEEILTWYAKGELESRIGYVGRVTDLFPNHAAFVADLERWWGLYQGMGLAKRIQAPPVLAVKRRAFGFDHRESQMGPRYTRRYAELKQRLLGTG